MPARWSRRSRRSARDDDLHWTSHRGQPRGRLHQPDGRRDRQLFVSAHERVDLLGALLRRADEGVRADAARPADLRDDDRRADHAARAVRLRDQHRSEGAADRGRGRGCESVHAQSLARAREHRLLQDRRSVRRRSEADRALQRGRGAVRRHHPGGFLAPAAARRAPRTARRGRCDRSGRDRQRARGAGADRPARRSTTI